MGRARKQLSAGSSHFAGGAEAMVYGAQHYASSPKYDSRFARAYSRNILQQGGFFAELAEEMRADGAGYREDAGISLMFARALEYIIQTPYEVDYPELRAAEFLPLMTEVPTEAATFTYRMLDRVGYAAVIQENGSDAPKVGLKGQEWQAPIITIGAAYDYTILDTLRAAKVGIPLESYKAEAARFACEYMLETIAAVGAPNSGVAGFTNAPGIAGTAQVSTGNWLTQIASIAAATTTNATPPAVAVTQAIISDINAAISKIFNQTDGLHTPTHILLPTAVYGALMTAPRSPGYTDDSLLDFIEKMTGLEVECWAQLNNAGAITTTYGGKSYAGRVMIYKKEPRLLNLVVAQPFTQLPPQAIRMAWEVTTYLRTGGVTVRYPLTATFIDGVA